MKPIRALIIEDSDADVFVVVEELRRAGFEPKFQRVNTAESLSAALNQDSWDIVLSDYAVGKFNSIEALHMIREIGLTMPFIVVSGADQEEVSRAILEAGASDFIAKGQLARFVSVVERELRDAKEREERLHALESLRHMEQRFLLFYEHAGLAYLALDAQGLLADVNPGLEKLLGYKREEVINRWFGSFLVPEEVEQFRQQWPQIIASETVQREYRLRTKHGHCVKVKVSGKNGFDDQGHYQQSYWILYDLSKTGSPTESPTLESLKPSDTSPTAETLSGILPICMYCKSIRDQKGVWWRLETFFEQRAKVHFSHGICPACVPKLQASMRQI